MKGCYRDIENVTRYFFSQNNRSVAKSGISTVTIPHGLLLLRHGWATIRAVPDSIGSQRGAAKRRETLRHKSPLTIR
jgi:hypothetical protein